jgi:hypothetical protein
MITPASKSWRGTEAVKSQTKLFADFLSCSNKVEGSFIVNSSCLIAFGHQEMSRGILTLDIKILLFK